MSAVTITAELAATAEIAVSYETTTPQADPRHSLAAPLDRDARASTLTREAAATGLLRRTR